MVPDSGADHKKKKLDHIPYFPFPSFTAHKIPMARDTFIHPSRASTESRSERWLHEQGTRGFRSGMDGAQAGSRLPVAPDHGL